MAEDRGLLLHEARYDSLVAAIDAPGLNALDLISNLRAFKPTAQTENEVAKQTNAAASPPAPTGRGVLHDIDVYLQGINAYIDSHNHTLGPFSHVRPFTLTDIYAFNALKDQFVGEGGGQRGRPTPSSCPACATAWAPRRAPTVWNDLREANDPEAPVSVPGHVQLPAAAQQHQRQRDPRPQQPVGAAPTPRCAVQRDVQGPRHQRAAGLGQALGHPPPDHGRRPADRLLLPRSDAGDGPRGPRHQPARRRPRRRSPGYIFIGRNQDSALVADLGRPGPDRHLRRDAVRPQRPPLHVRRQVPPMQFFNAGRAQPRHARRAEGHLLPHGPRTGHSVTPASTAGWSRSRASARATARTCSTCSSTASSPTVRSTTCISSSGPRT